MTQFAGWFEQALGTIAEVDSIRAPALFRRSSGAMGGLAKWLAYLDQYVVLTLRLAFRHRDYDLVLIADHANAPSAMLTPRSKCVVMVHDTLAIQQARGQLAGAPPVGRGGRLLQTLILAGIRRASLLLINPGPVDAELTALGVSSPRVMVGCPADPERLDVAEAPANAPRPGFLLNVGSDGWRKRKADLLKLWRARSGQGLPDLVLVGHTDGATRDQVTALDLTDRVILYPSVSNAELGWFYRNCAALVVSGHYEGFCIPVAEASYFDKPVFGPQAAAIYPKIFGEAVSLIDMATPETGAAQLSERIATGRVAPASLRRAVAEKWSRRQFEDRVRAALSAKLGLDEHPAAVDER